MRGGDERSAEDLRGWPSGRIRKGARGKADYGSGPETDCEWRRHSCFSLGPGPDGQQVCSPNMEFTLAVLAHLRSEMGAPGVHPKKRRQGSNEAEKRDHTA